MRDDIVSRREVMASLVAEYNRRYSEGGLKLAWIEKAVNDTPALQPSGGRLIDADRLKQHYAWWPENERTVLDQIVDVQPTIDAVPVVRCRECKGWVATGNSDLGICALTKRVVTRRDYCSWGERKDGSDNA